MLQMGADSSHESRWARERSTGYWNGRWPIGNPIWSPSGQRKHFTGVQHQENCAGKRAPLFASHIRLIDNMVN